MKEVNIMMNDIYEALETIRKECKKYSKCADCPLREYDPDGSCSVREKNPCDWKLVGDEDRVPRLFK